MVNTLLKIAGFAVIAVVIVLLLIGIFSSIHSAWRDHKEWKQKDLEYRSMIWNIELDAGICPITEKPCKKGAGLNDQPLPCSNCRKLAQFLELPKERCESLEDYSE